ncbi:MAG: ATP-binding cassette domain-containing protein, partial [Schleiferilactobacillus harbinensis]|nr:ATP-binding cassette domain-containing protein [Schleiferilactobacillus harbinensis]
KNIDPAGVDISGGEAQKIAIARAWYKDAPFIILDEPTAALDPVSEYEIYQKFDDLMEKKTAIYVSHRMSSTRFSQRIVVLDHGQIVEDGTHAALMQAQGLYYRLFEAQAQYYTADKIKAERKNADAAYAID